MTMTTIKLDSQLRDRLNVVARERGMTTGSLVEDLFESWLREQHFAEVRDAMARTPAQAMASWRDETAQWETTANDGPGGDVHPADPDVIGSTPW